MKEIRRSSVYNNWFMSLRDSRARYRILTRIRRLAMGNPGDKRTQQADIAEARKIARTYKEEN